MRHIRERCLNLGGFVTFQKDWHFPLLVRNSTLTHLTLADKRSLSATRYFYSRLDPFRTT